MGQVNTLPLEILAAPLTVYFAPVGTDFPLVDAVPAVDWVKLGTGGPLNYKDDGITVEQSQTLKYFRALGDSGSRKVFRSEEDLKVSLMLVDMTLEQYRVAINSNSVTTVAAGGEAGYKKIGLSRGLSVATMALLVRGPSVYMELGTGQFEIPVCVQSGNPKPVFKRDDPVSLAVEWTALVDPTAASPSEYFGRLVFQTADAIS